MREENVNRLKKYVEKDTKPFSGITNAVKEIENMQKAKVHGKKFHEIDAKRGFYPQHPAIKSVQRKAKEVAKKMAKKAPKGYPNKFISEREQETSDTKYHYKD